MEQEPNTLVSLSVAFLFLSPSHQCFLLTGFRAVPAPAPGSPALSLNHGGVPLPWKAVSSPLLPSLLVGGGWWECKH